MGRDFRGEFGTYGHGYLFLSRGPFGPMAATEANTVLEPTPAMNVLLYIYICNLFCFALCVNK
jgi:hypothetical protein